ncbi:MAG: HupE/UreJ family protein [Piscirickettsiaceae bacterium]|nr:HupE/UreJ family protein [Piscirickettsiaceae bacterium]
MLPIPYFFNRTAYVIVGLLLLGLFSQMAFAHGMSDAEKQIIIDGGNLRYIWIGATHMLSGYDHLAFVFGIIFFLTKFKDIVKYITAFTVGHSITLIFATFNSIQINYFLIDAVIALSVCYIAFHNLDGFKRYLNIKAPNMLLMIFSLGLIHGLGLSTRLQQLPLNPDELLLNIISFNVGIELGQISALAIMLLLINVFRKSHFFPTFSKISNYFLVLAGAFLFLMQMHGYEHSANADEFTTNVEPASPVSNSEQTQQSDWKDTIRITIPARGSKEYKLQLSKSAVLNYAWQTDKGDLFFDLHGEPQGDTTGYFKTFRKGTKSDARGSLTTTFTGTHGWYWKNSNAFPVIITLKVFGEYQRLDLEPSQDLKPKPNPTHDTID